MDNAFVVDGLLAAVLLLGTLIGAFRGLFKTLMGLLAVAGALIGSIVLTNVLTGPITDMVAPAAENALVEQFSEKFSASAANLTAGGETQLGELLEGLKLPKELTESMLAPLLDAARDGAAATKDKAADLFRSAVSAGVRSLVGGVVRSVLLLVSYPLLLLLLKLLTRLLDHVFDLPVLGTLNRVGGGALGFLEALLLLFVVVFVCAHLGVKPFSDPPEGAILLPLLVNHSPVELLTSL